MNPIKAFKYLWIFILPLAAIISFYSYGWMTYLPVLISFFLVPILELFYKPSTKNIRTEIEKEVGESRIYDYMLYLIVPAQLTCLGLFLITIGEPGLNNWDIAGRISSLGLLCGVMGINVAHELGHRSTKHERFMSKVLLLTSLYMHFYIEHNRGHHRNVSTAEDPSTARKGEILFAFWIRSIFYSYISAWKLESEKLEKNGKRFWSLSNEMLRFQFFQLVLVAGIWLIFGMMTSIYFVICAVIGWLLLETVQYIEHYGLTREKKGDRYERVMPHHSWNSNHKVGRVILFELSRHSDHHYIASRKYQILRHIDESPQMPTGYPGMMLMATIPPLWFKVMNKRI